MRTFLQCWFWGLFWVLTSQEKLKTLHKRFIASTTNNADRNWGERNKSRTLTILNQCTCKSALLNSICVMWCMSVPGFTPVTISLPSPMEVAGAQGAPRGELRAVAGVGAVQGLGSTPPNLTPSPVCPGAFNH